MRCPRCHSAFSHVRRTMKVGKVTTRRYRQCHHCKKNFVTTETVQVKKEKKKNKFDPDEDFIIGE